MLVLDYNDVEKSLFPLWKTFVEHMDAKNVNHIGPQGQGVEKRSRFSAVKGTGAIIFPILEQYLTMDTSVDLATREIIFYDTLKHAEHLKLFEKMDNDPQIFSLEQSQSFADNQSHLQKLADAQNRKVRSTEELDMNEFFVQLEQKKLKDAVQTYEQHNKHYLIIDEMKYLETVLNVIVGYCRDQCLRQHNGVAYVKLGDLETSQSELSKTIKSGLQRKFNNVIAEKIIDFKRGM